jgi:hypothetical protein
MKIYYSKLLALFAFHPNVWETAAFVVQTPKKALALKGFHAYREGEQEVSPSSYSYLTTDGEVSEKKKPGSGVPNGDISEMANKKGAASDKAASYGDMQVVPDIWETTSPVTVQGGSLRTLSFTTEIIERVQVLLKSEGRPVNALVELWQGPNNSPQKMKVYIEDGSVRPFCAVIETPRGNNAIAIRNTGNVEFPLIAGVVADIGDSSTGLGAVTKTLSDRGSKKIVQGGAVHTYPFASKVASVQILLKTDGRPLNARIELLQGPNNNKQVVEIYSEDGRERPFFAVIDTPDSGNVVRIVNTATMEFPMTASVEPYLIEPGSTEDDIDSYFIVD